MENRLRNAAKPVGKRAGYARAGHLVLVLLGAYCFTWAMTACMAVALHRLGMARSESALLVSLLGFALYPALALYAFAVWRPMRSGCLLVGGGAALAAAGHLLGGA